MDVCILLTNNKTHPLAHTIRKRWKDTWHIQNDLFTRQNWRFFFYITPVRLYKYIVNGEILLYKMVQRFINIFPITKVFGCYLLSSIITNKKKLNLVFDVCHVNCIIMFRNTVYRIRWSNNLFYSVWWIRRTLIRIKL